ncbi:SEC-C metal-binding domain-containing protein [Halomonas mongoliensis]|uniref:SEC-C metal-binding domain-containing protein n=1 Tax=Halomonas mongoliensis TaxID=321265 RepID=UPI00403B28C4
MVEADLPEIPAELEISIKAFFEASLRHILQHESADAYFAALDEITRRSGITEWFDPEMPYWRIARTLWDKAPLPSRGFRPDPLPEPKRNDPCPCGSGKKFKRCCQPLPQEHALALDDELPVLQIAAPLFTLKQRKEAARQAPPKLRLVLAERELEENHPGKARTQLLKLLKEGGLDADLQALAVHLLGDAYNALGHHAAGEKALSDLLPNLKPPAAAEALHWLTGQALLDGRPAEALLHLHQAEALDPDSLSNGLYRVLCLRDIGADAEAQRTAQEWLPIARELGLEDAIAFFEEQASLATLPDAIPDDEGEFEAFTEDAPDNDNLMALFGAPDELLRPVAGLLKAALRQPLYPVSFEPGPPGPGGDETQWVLMLPPEVEQAQAALYQAGDDQDPLDPDLIRQHPALLQSLDFLEQLDDFAGAAFSSAQQQFNEALQRQQERLIAQVLEALPQNAQLPWGWLEHRPLLRLMMQNALEQEDPSEAIRGLSRLLALCPNDNLGVRAPLVNALLRQGQNEAALAICERYPDDPLAETHYGRVLALVRLSRLHEAEEALFQAYRALPKVLNYLIAGKRKQPTLNPHGMTIGGADQAWYYREEMRDLFQATPGALGWMESLKKRLR